MFREIVHPEKFFATEKFDDAWYPGQAVDTTVFEETGGVTKMTLTVLYESREARGVASRSDMEKGMIAGYDRLDKVLSTVALA